MAATVGVTKDTLSLIERRKIKSINIELARKLARELNCTYEYLMGWSPDPLTTGLFVENPDNPEMKIPIKFDHTAPCLKQRIFDLCGEDEVILQLIADCLEKAPPKEKKFLKGLLENFLNYVSSECKKK